MSLTELVHLEGPIALAGTPKNLQTMSTENHHAIT